MTTNLGHEGTNLGHEGTKTRRRRQLIFLTFVTFVSSWPLIFVSSWPHSRVFVAAQAHTMDKLAEQYVKLVLAMGQHDADYVDAFYGPAEWRTQAEAAKRPLADLDA